MHGGYGTTWAVILKCQFPLAWNSWRWLGWPASPKPSCLRRWDYNKHKPSPPICLCSPTPLSFSLFFFYMDSKNQTYIFLLVNPLGVVMSLRSSLVFFVVVVVICFVSFFYIFHKNLWNFLLPVSDHNSLLWKAIKSYDETQNDAFGGYVYAHETQTRKKTYEEEQWPETNKTWWQAGSAVTLPAQRSNENADLAQNLNWAFVSS